MWHDHYVTCQIYAQHGFLDPIRVSVGLGQFDDNEVFTQRDFNQVL